ncbi:hypothetical protein HDU79_003880 [Rhizoclosmatium sp. JEL0117]|nr:hypothetical protein HDU79_003880 [Rhizoclosmatium sp. JEL0117]
MALAVSPNGRYMASAATDHTTKLWGVVSYMKDVDVVQAELREANQKSRQLDKYIDVLDEKYDIQIKMQEFVGLRVGEVPIPTGYHSDLIFTFRHDSTVLSVAFNPASDICITGSMDSTCRLWSCRRGDLLFQINVPAPVSSVISSMDSEEMYLVCQNRVLIFGYQASAKEEELPETWRISADAFYSGDNTRAKNTPDTRVYVDSDEEDLDQMDPEKLAAKKATMTISELKQLISHGLVLPSFLDTLLAQFPDVDAERLIYLMKKYKLHPRQLLQLLVNSKYHPRDILMALSGKVDTGKLYELALSPWVPGRGPVSREGVRFNEA